MLCDALPQVRYLKVIEKSGYQALPWVRYITTGGEYEIRSCPGSYPSILRHPCDACLRGFITTFWRPCVHCLSSGYPDACGELMCVPAARRMT